MAHILEDKKMLKKTETIISDDGKKYWRYKSLLKSVKFEFLDSDFHIEIEQNEFPDNDDREPRSTRSVNIYPGELMLKK